MDQKGIFELVAQYKQRHNAKMATIVEKDVSDLMVDDRWILGEQKKLEKMIKLYDKIDQDLKEFQLGAQDGEAYDVEQLFKDQRIWEFEISNAKDRIQLIWNDLASRRRMIIKMQKLLHLLS
jgi:hypothetical protein